MNNNEYLKEQATYAFVNLVLYLIIGVMIIGSLFLLGYLYNHYALWSAEITGRQELALATGNRQIVIQEAIAKKEAAKELADAEIIRAKGVAEANQIIGDSLKGNDSYLRYLWITQLDHASSNQVIYIPTEANIPIMEAGRFKQSNAKITE
jgi:hypothetical protein